MDNQNDDAAIWWESRHADIQEHEVPEETTSFVNIDEKGEEVEEQQKVTNTEVRTELNLAKLQEPTAGIVVGLMDSLIPVLFALVLKGTSEDKIKLTSDEKENLTSAWAQYLKDVQVNLTPGMVLLGTIAIIYGSKITVALSDRNKEKKESEEIASLRKELEELKKILPDAA